MHILYNYIRLEDPDGEIETEQQKWLRRQMLLSSVIEQLKGKDFKMLIANMVACKSKLLKKWKQIDIK